MLQEVAWCGDCEHGDREANAQFIVTAVNYHERLVEALRTVVDAVHDFDPDGEAIDNTYTEGAVVLLNELLDTKKD